MILFFLIKMEGPLPAREPAENNEPRGSVRRSELNRNGARRWAGESEEIIKEEIIPQKTMNGSTEKWLLFYFFSLSLFIGGN